MSDWKDLTRLAAGDRLVVERVRLAAAGIAVEGSFELPALAQLPLEDQVFVAAFVRCHGSIKDMERLLGVSYPTVKSRLGRIAERLGPPLAVETDVPPEPARPGPKEILDRLERGELTAEQAAAELRRTREGSEP